MDSPYELYLALMKTVRGRLDVIQELRLGSANHSLRAESAAFHGRKIIEAIAFGCLVAIENGLDTIPSDAKGQWNAESILRRLKKKDLSGPPEPEPPSCCHPY